MKIDKYAYQLRELLYTFQSYIILNGQRLSFAICKQFRIPTTKPLRHTHQYVKILASLKWFCYVITVLDLIIVRLAHCVILLAYADCRSRLYHVVNNEKQICTLFCIFFFFNITIRKNDTQYNSFSASIYYILEDKQYHSFKTSLQVYKIPFSFSCELYKKLAERKHR